MAIKLQLDGFEKLIKDIEKAQGNVEKATEKAVRNSATVMQDTLKTEMQKAKVPRDLVEAMPPPEIQKDFGVISASVGYKKGAYNPDNLSDGYKVVFLNYGTPHRKEHGQIVARGFIKKAKRKAKKPIQAEQEKAFNEILKGLKQ